jgi:lipase maturation factor 1
MPGGGAMLIPKPLSPCFAVSRWIFARALGVIFFCAFGSLALQVRGLIGSRGIVPAREFLEAAQTQLGATAYWEVPTLCWLSASDGFLVALSVIGVLLSAVLTVGFYPRFCAIFLWLLYLSLTSVASPFLGFQWDALLLETGLLAIFLFPHGRQPNWRRMNAVPRIAHILLCWLLFRLMFESGVVKLASRDPTWWSLSALDYHFETQPLPIWTSWYVNQTPHWLLAFATLFVFAVEFVAPCLMVAPRRFRHWAAGVMISLQLVIFATGNYAFFNLLTIALCALLFDDEFWPRRWRAFIRLNSTSNARSCPAWTLRVATSAACFVAVLTALPLFLSLGWFQGASGFVVSAESVLAPLRSFNGYGLFAIMTTSRHEIVIEGSDDGVLWREYEFPWKPGDLDERPGLVAPYQPRLDWQMWFAALGDREQNPWFGRLIERLLEGSPEVLGLFRRNPFSDHPPRVIRATVYDYKFTQFGDAGSAWWKRELLGLYYPPSSLRPPERR